MLSVIVYGRNDSHGYDLHKRAALSLNAIAHVLNDPDDEIIFVDYNSPDELPAFVETIADTLTGQAKRRLRVIRVRAGYHAQFASKTPLQVLEPQSRNIAIRRMNPTNRWVLSTNTDMIFAPKRDGETLSSICARLSNGFYHLPRFEVPEGFWERADRRDPESFIAAMREHGWRYRLDQVVHGGFDNLYEAPGDFQLFLRDDVFTIGGFDERMIWGWHADTNIARRMRLLRGKVDTLEDALSGYHCGHTRQATGLHGGGGSSNSLDVFVRQVASPHWTSDLAGWGAHGTVFEDLKLSDDRGRSHLAAIARAVGEPDAPVPSSTYADDTYCEEGFEASAILPHVCDVLFNQPKGASIFVVGSDVDFVSGLLRFGQSASVQLNASLCADGASPGLADVGLWDVAPFVPLERGLRDADIVLIQYPNARTVASDARGSLEWFALRAFERLVEIERAKPPHARRPVIVVNGMHTLMEACLGAGLRAPSTPFAGRLRFGRVKDHVRTEYATTALQPGEFEIARDLDRLGGFSAADRNAISAAALGSANWERLALELLAIADHAETAEGLLGVRRAQLNAIADAARVHIDALSARPVKAPVKVGARADWANRLCSAADWEDASWLKCAERYFGEGIYSLDHRSRWIWERVSLLVELEARAPARSGAKVLVISDAPDIIPALLSHRGHQVAYATLEELLEGERVDWSPTLRMPGLPLPGSLRPLAKVQKTTRFDAVIAPMTTLLGDRGKLSAMIERVAPFMSSEAHFGVSTLVHLTQMEGGGALSFQEYLSALLDGGVLAAAGLHGDAPVDDRIPLDTVVKFARNDAKGSGVHGLSFGYVEDAIVTVGQLWARFPRLEGSDARADQSASAGVKGPATQRLAAASRKRDLETAAHPAIFASARRSLLPFVTSGHCQRRSPIEIVLVGEGGGVEFSVPVGDFSGSLRFDLAFAEAVSPQDVRAKFVGEEVTVPAYVTATQCGFQVLISPPIASQGIVVFNIDRPSVDIIVLAAWSERRVGAEV